MMRLFRPIVVSLGGLTLAMTMPAGAAVAANGTFAWVGPQGKAYVIQNPPDNKCFDMAQEARGAENATKKPLFTYTRKRCHGTMKRLAPGQSAPSDAHFSSVIFNSRPPQGIRQDPRSRTKSPDPAAAHNVKPDETPQATPSPQTTESPRATASPHATASPQAAPLL